MPLGSVFKGIEGVRAFYQSIAPALPDLRIEVTSEYDVPGCSIREVVISGTHRGEFAGKPLGNSVRIEMAAFYTFDTESEKLIAEKIYYDQSSACSRCKATKQRRRLCKEWHPTRSRDRRSSLSSQNRYGASSASGSPDATAVAS